MRDILDLRIKEMKCGGKLVPEKYIACFNSYIENIIANEYNIIKKECIEQKEEIEHLNKRLEECKKDGLRIKGENDTEYIRRYRVINNHSYTKNNYELPYTIVEVDYNPETNMIREVGSDIWTNHSCDLFDERKRVEAHFGNMITNTFLYSLKKRIQEIEEERLSYVEGSFINGNIKCGKCGFYIGGRPDFQPNYCHCCGSKLNWYNVTDFEEADKKQEV